MQPAWYWSCRFGCSRRSGIAIARYPVRPWPRRCMGCLCEPLIALHPRLGKDDISRRCSIPGNYGTREMRPERPEACRAALDAIVRMPGSRRLLFGSVCVLLIRLVTADDASSDSADFAVPRQMARYAANDGASDASLRLGGGARKGEAQNERLHRDSPKKRVAATIGMAATGSVRSDIPAGPIRSYAVPASASADADNRTRMCNNFRAEESD